MLLIRENTLVSLGRKQVREKAKFRGLFAILPHALT